MKQIHIADVIIDVEQKNIKNIHLKVCPPEGRVKISAPFHTDLDVLRVYALSKLRWIKKQQLKFVSQEREVPRDYISRESHYFQGKRYLLEVVEEEAPPRVELKHSTIVLYVRPGTSTEKRKHIMDEWYRKQLKELVPALIEKWEKKLHVKVRQFGIKKMKTRWGTCNHKAKRIWLNLELAKKPVECLEYIIVHEMVHLKERKHNEVFVGYLDKHLPKWRFYKDMLNSLPVKQENWSQ